MGLVDPKYSQSTLKVIILNYIQKQTGKSSKKWPHMAKQDAFITTQVATSKLPVVLRTGPFVQHIEVVQAKGV